MALGPRQWWNGHVAAAVQLVEEATGPFEQVVAEARAVLGEWPGPRQCLAGAAAVLKGSADGVFGAALSGAVVPADARLVHCGLRRGWLVGGQGHVTASDELKALAGVGVVPDPAGFLARRAQFELTWFWRPVAALAEAARTGRPPACFGAPGHAEEFRRAAALLNLTANAGRAATAHRVATDLGAHNRPMRTLEVGASVWGPAFAVHPGSSLTTVDYAAALEAVAPPRGFAHDPATYRPHDDGYDVVVLPDVLHTVPPDTVPCWLADLAAALRPGGVLVIVDPLVNAQRTWPAEHLMTQVKLAVSGGGQIWDVAALRRVLRAAGLRPDRPRVVRGLQVVTAAK